MKLIKLTKGQFAQVDDEDYEYLNQWKWFAKHSRGNYYAVRRQKDISLGKIKDIYMNKIILNTPINLECDHIDHNGLNNQKVNLRNCDRFQNMRNRRPWSSSGKLGVYLYKHYIYAQIKVNGKSIHIGNFKTIEDAALAYDKVAKIHFGEFAYLNYK